MKNRRPIYSITIDDDLVNKAKALSPEKNFSQIVREALEFYIRLIELRNEVAKELTLENKIMFTKWELDFMLECIDLALHGMEGYSEKEIAKLEKLKDKLQKEKSK